MKRSTSSRAYQRLLHSGRLAVCQMEAYEALYSYGPLTGSEVVAKSGYNGAWKRLSELSDLGYIRVVGRRVCTISKRKALIWDVTKMK